MSTLNLVVPGADFSSVGLGKIIPIPDIRTSLYAAYLLGTDYPSNAGVKDITGNGRDATLVGGTLGAKALQSSPTIYADLPFSPNNVLAANGEMTMVVIAQPRVPATNAYDLLAGTFYNGGSFNQVGAALSTSAKVCQAWSGGSVSPAIASQDTGLGTVPEMFASSVSATALTAYMGRTGIASVTSTVARSAAVPSDVGTIRLGGAKSGDANFGASAPLIHGALFYNKALTAAELASVQASMKTLLAGYGVSL